MGNRENRIMTTLVLFGLTLLLLQLLKGTDAWAQQPFSRRAFLASSTASVVVTVAAPATAKYILNEEGEYEEIEEGDWQTAWKGRFDKAKSMSTDEIFNAARGAGNVDLKEGPESDASKKRRAMSACREASVRDKAGVPDAKECNARVLQGDVNFILDAL